MRICKDGRIWGQTNKEAGTHLGILTRGSSNNRIKKGRPKTHYWKIGGEFKKGNMSGNKHWNWKGGITPKNKKRFFNYEWNILRKKIYARDKWTCQICGVHCGNKLYDKNRIQCHHIIPYRITQDNSEGNLITLCLSCHHKEEKKYYNNIKQYEFNFKEVL